MMVCCDNYCMLSKVADFLADKAPTFIISGTVVSKLRRAALLTPWLKKSRYSAVKSAPLLQITNPVLTRGEPLK